MKLSAPKRWFKGIKSQLSWKLQYHMEYALRYFRVVAAVGLVTFLKAHWKYCLSFRQLKNLSGKARVIKGRLEAFAETGTEGAVWMLNDSATYGYEALKPIEQGDKLIIFAHDGAILFSGFIDQDREVGYQPYPLNPQYGQPCAFDYWIHWTQRGWGAEEWADLFLNRSGSLPYRAILVKLED